MHGYSRITKLQSLLALALITLLAVIVLPTTGTSDVFDWLDWGKNVYENGLVNGYVINHHEHPPFFSAILYSAMAISNALAIYPFYGLKITFLAFLLASIAVIYFWSNRNSATVVIFSIPLIYSCLSLSYMDIYFTPFFLLSMYFISREKPVPATIFFMFAALIKFPPLIIAPFLITYSYCHFKKLSTSQLGAIKKFLIHIILPSTLLIFITYLIFGNELFLSLLRSFSHNCISCNALNFNRYSQLIIYNFLTDQSMVSALLNKTLLVEIQPITQNFFNEMPYTIAYILFPFFYISVFIKFLLQPKSPQALLMFCLLAHLSYFTFSKGVHENHMYLSMLLAISLSLMDEKNFILALNICLISSINMFVYYGVNGMPLNLWWVNDGSMYSSDAPSLNWLATGQYPFDKELSLSLFQTAYFLAFWSGMMFLPKSSNPTSTQSAPLA